MKKLLLLFLVLINYTNIYALTDSIWIKAPPDIKYFENGLIIIGDTVHEGLIQVTKLNKGLYDGNHSGFADINGNIVVPLEYSYIADYSGFENGFASVGKNSNSFYNNNYNEFEYYGFVDNTGKLIIPTEYQYTIGYSEGLFLVCKDYKWGFVDSNNKVIIPLIYDEGYLFKDGIAEMRKDEKTIFIDKNGNEVYPNLKNQTHLSYKQLKQLIDNKKADISKIDNDFPIICHNNGKYGAINKYDNIIIDFLYDKPFEFLNGTAIVEKAGISGVINEKGVIIADIVYDYAEILNNSWIILKNKNNYRLIKSNGEIIDSGEISKNVISCKYYIDGELLVCSIKENIDSEVKVRFGAYGKNGKIVIPFIYDYFGDISEGLAPVGKKQNGVIKYGYIDTKGNTVIPFIYDMAFKFSEGYAVVEKDGKRGLIKNPN